MTQKRGRLKPHQTQSVVKQTLDEKPKAIDLPGEGLLLLSFRHLDRNQGQTLQEWEYERILAQGVDVIANSCNSKLTEVFNSKKCTIYGNFPPRHKTEFIHPKHVPLDAQWARVHVNGKQCIIGHVVANIFYVVFLDKDHDFWDAPKKNT